ncbi:hypothetical protein M409DRAFT_24615 [Zasmidium cellare ATCC 36951]|uniref:Large ribosomal subunit protein mL67 n=1 Tax=Zasmidium cellare ATCC 36951 TaxID=1080233 RepID=A0A6A6CH11_ZASCE|nr:uncharacterized protein M409DRAFT_24615 [Zasmidium cellare ATCC 36951]KAF2165232.1 hypothetical protein M409DRAFT_24615 [Zasmidium cellare ATCC 36951]
MRAPSQEVVAGSGRHIYAYCNVRSNQVLYSLSRKLKDSSLEQLPDVGANHKPPTIRPDLWKPLYSVTLPSPEQGLRLFKRLKDWRKLHELCWEPPSYLSNPYTEKQIAEMKEKLENRGGSKKETVFDLIKRQKKKMKQKIVMNQKANSIADLAAVLIEQEEQGTLTAEKRQKELELKLKDEFELIYKLAEEYEEGGLKKLDDEIEIMRAMRREGVDGFKNKLLEKSNLAKERRQKMLYANAAVREAKAFVNLPSATRQKEIDHWRTIAEIGEYSKPGEWKEFRDREFWSDSAFVATMQREYGQTWERIAVACRAEGYRVPGRELEGETKAVSGDGILAAKKETEPQPSPENVQQVSAREKEGEESDYKTIVPRFPPRLDRAGFPLQESPKRASAKYALMRENAPIFTTKGVKIEWANFLDAEFAQAWPEAVEHEPMGGKREKYEAIQQQREERKSRHELRLAEMVELKREEMDLPQERSQEDILLEEIEEESRQEKTPEESAAEMAAAEDLEAREAAARESAIQTLKDIRNRQRLPPQLESIQSEILARVQAKAIEERWRGAPRRPQVSSSVEQQSADSTSAPPAQ